jgi:hypothetical protein
MAKILVGKAVNPFKIRLRHASQLPHVVAKVKSTPGVELVILTNITWVILTWVGCWWHSVIFKLRIEYIYIYIYLGGEYFWTGHCVCVIAFDWVPTEELFGNLVFAYSAHGWTLLLSGIECVTYTLRLCRYIHLRSYIYENWAKIIINNPNSWRDLQLGSQLIGMQKSCHVGSSRT